MKQFLALAIATVLLAGGAQAERTWVLHGLFCNTEAQARGVMGHFGSGISLQGAVAEVNEGAVNCVVADRVKYVVSQPLVIDTLSQNGFKLTLYQARLVGIQIGGNIRPILPPMPTYFVLGTRLDGVATLSDM
jgi:hypothetical protein